MKAAVICVGNELMLDDGVGIEVYRQLMDAYEFPDEVDVMHAGCMTLDMLEYVGEYDLMLTVDAVEGTGEPPGTVFRYTPDDVARRGSPMGSLHELRLADLFDAAALLGYSCEGVCLGMQVENASPSEFAVGLTPPVEEHVPRLVDALLAELVLRGFELKSKPTGEAIRPGFHHRGRSVPGDA